MRITVELPDELLKRAKLAAVERGVTLRNLIGDALPGSFRRSRKRRQDGKECACPSFPPGSRAPSN